LGSERFSRVGAGEHSFQWSIAANAAITGRELWKWSAPDPFAWKIDPRFNKAHARGEWNPLTVAATWILPALHDASFRECVSPD